MTGSPWQHWLFPGEPSLPGSTMKHTLRIVLCGVTNNQLDPLVDILRAIALPLLKQFGIDGESLALKTAEGECLLEEEVKCFTHV